jgi:hypothetical protein
MTHPSTTDGVSRAQPSPNPPDPFANRLSDIIYSHPRKIIHLNIRGRRHLSVILDGHQMPPALQWAIRGRFAATVRDNSTPHDPLWYPESLQIRSSERHSKGCPVMIKNRVGAEVSHWRSFRSSSRGCA